MPVIRSVSSPDRRSQADLSPGRALVVLWLATILFYLPTVRHLLSIWTGNVVFHHQPLVFAIAGWLIWRRVAHAGGPEGKSVGNAITRLPIALAALLSWGWFVAWLADLAIGMHAALIGLLGVAALVLVPPARWRMLRFPLGYLLLSLPAGLLLVPSLMSLTAWLAVKTLALSGVSFWQDGFHIGLVTPRGLVRFSIEAACSGVRYLFASFAAGLLFAWIAASGLRRLAVVGIFLLIPIFANALRAAGILLLASTYGHAVAQGIDHRIYGLAFFLVTLALSFLLSWPLTASSGGSRSPAAHTERSATAGVRISLHRLAGFLGAVAFGPGLALLWRVIL